MKSFVWLLTLALIVLCLTGWVMSELVEHSLRDLGYRIIIPHFTNLMILPHGWVLLVPIPWIVSAIFLTVRSKITESSGSLFAGTLLFTAVVLVCILVIALTLPYIPRKP